MLLAAQRQEGLRQTILESVSESGTVSRQALCGLVHALRVRVPGTVALSRRDVE